MDDLFRSKRQLYVYGDVEEVRVNDNKKILKSFIGWLPLALSCLVFYGMIFVFLSMYVLSNVFDVEQALARQIGGVAGVVLLLLLAYLCTSQVTKSLSSYHLSIGDNSLRVRGKSGWRALEIDMPINEIKEINIGQSGNHAEKISMGHGAIKDQVASRLNFIPASGKPFKLEFAAKAFDNESLYEFMVFAKTKGILTNVGVQKISLADHLHG